jgi:hypothetical protein
LLLVDVQVSPPHGGTEPQGKALGWGHGSTPRKNCAGSHLLILPPFRNGGKVLDVGQRQLSNSTRSPETQTVGRVQPSDRCPTSKFAPC